MRTTNKKFDWSHPVSADEAARRAGGRRRYNYERRFRAWVRRLEIIRVYSGIGPWRRGEQAALARRLGVSRSVICRDVEAIRKVWRKRAGCSHCGHFNWGVDLTGDDLMKLF